MLVGTRGNGLCILEVADLLGFSQTIISKVYREWSYQQMHFILSFTGNVLKNKQTKNRKVCTHSKHATEVAEICKQLLYRGLLGINSKVLQQVLIVGLHVAVHCH